jgi:hypothetical protein
MSIELIAKEYNKQDGLYTSDILSKQTLILLSRRYYEGLSSDLKSGLPELADLRRSTGPERGRIYGS